MLSITLDKKDRMLEMASFCLSHQDASTDKQRDLFCSLRDLDLKSNFNLDLSRLDNISLKAPLREKHDDAIANLY